MKKGRSGTLTHDYKRHGTTTLFARSTCSGASPAARLADTQLVNMIRGLLAEFGIAIPKGITNALAFVRRAAAGEANEVPDLATKVIAALAEQAIEVQGRIRQLERDLLASFRLDDLARRIATVPGVGLLGATAIAATVTDPTQFRSGRQFAAWLGLTPLNNSSGGKERLGRISKMGD